MFESSVVISPAPSLTKSVEVSVFSVGSTLERYLEKADLSFKSKISCCLSFESLQPKRDRDTSISLNSRLS